jgi:hypothetical protein
VFFEKSGHLADDLRVVGFTAFFAFEAVFGGDLIPFVDPFEDGFAAFGDFDVGDFGVWEEDLGFREEVSFRLHASHIGLAAEDENVDGFFGECRGEGDDGGEKGDNEFSHGDGIFITAFDFSALARASWRDFKVTRGRRM